jgi:hypothetical protein
MLRKVSWVLLALVSVLTLLGALASAQLGYSGGEDQIGPVALEELAAGRPEVAQAIHGRRGFRRSPALCRPGPLPSRRGLVLVGDCRRDGRGLGAHRRPGGLSSHDSGSGSGLDSARSRRGSPAPGCRAAAQAVSLETSKGPPSGPGPNRRLLPGRKARPRSRETATPPRQGAPGVAPRPARPGNRPPLRASRDQ